jgi:serine-type D-Ala-D-Ala carboxypeptidase/endopeptidase
MRERICRPLGMRDTMVTLTGEQAARQATGYTRRGRPAPPLQLPALAGAGALRSTATDMVCLLRPTSTLPPPRWRHSWSARSSPGLRVARRAEVGLGWLIARPPGAAGPLPGPAAAQGSGQRSRPN